MSGGRSAGELYFSSACFSQPPRQSLQYLKISYPCHGSDGDAAVESSAHQLGSDYRPLPTMCVLRLQHLERLAPMGAGTNVLDFEDSRKQHPSPLGSLIYLLFCTSCIGWGGKNSVKKPTQAPESNFQNGPESMFPISHPGGTVHIRTRILVTVP